MKMHLMLRSIIIVCLFLGLSSVFGGFLGGGTDVLLAQMDPSKVFPTWDSGQMEGVIDKNSGGKTLLYFLPRFIDLMLIFTAPLVILMFLYSGLRFIYAGDSDDQVAESKKFFLYGLLGLIFIVSSYSIMKVVYFLLSG